MDIAAILLTFTVLVLVGLYLYSPYLRGYGSRVTREEHELSALMAEQDRVLSSLQELDFDYKLGKIPEEDYPAQRSSLLQKGADLLRKIDALKHRTACCGRTENRRRNPRQKANSPTKYWNR